MGFLDGLFETKARGGKTKENEYLVGSPDGISRALGASNAARNGSQPMSQAGPWDAEQAIKRGYENVIWVFRAVDAIAANQANLPILLRKGIDRVAGEVVEDDRLFRLLNFRTNTYESSWQFRYRLSTQLLLSRRGAFVEIVKGRDGRPSELHLLPVGKTKPVPDTKRFVAGYEIERADNKTDMLDTDSVIWMRMKPHPTDPYAQMTPLVAAGIEADTDYLARVFNRNFLASDGRPGMLITVDPGDQPMSIEDQELLKQRFNGGPALAGQTTVIEGRGINAQDMGSNPRDVQWSELLAASKERILMAFGTPETVMGNASGRTFDNADAERENWWMDTMVQHCNNIAFGLDALTGDINDDTVFGYDYSSVDVLQRAAANRREEYRSEYSAGLKTADDYFEAAGKEKWDRPETRVLFLPNGLIVGKTQEDQQLADELMKKIAQMGQPPMPGDPSAGGVPGQMNANSVAGAMAGMESAQRKWGNDIAARLATLNSKSITDKSPEAKVVTRPREHRAKAQRKTDTSGSDATDHQKSLEGMVLGVLESWDTRQSNVVPERLTHAKVRKNTRHWEGGTDNTKALDPKYVLDVDTWSTDLVETLERQVTQMVNRVTTRSVENMLVNGVATEMINAGQYVGGGRGLQKLYQNRQEAEAAKEEIVDLVMDDVYKAVSNYAERIERVIQDMDAQGEELPAIKRRVRSMINNRGSWRKLLAANVATRTVEAAQKLAYDRSDGRMTGVWRAHADERTRDTHKAADGQLRGSDGKFQVGAVRLAFPGDPTGPPEETINCRCHIEWRTTRVGGVG